MNEFWIFILVALFTTNSLEKTESVKVKLELKTFDEIFGEGWWDKDEAEDLKTPSTDHNPPLTESDHSGQIEPNSSDQNPPLTESDHSDNVKNGEEQNQIMKEISLNEKHKIINKFHAIKDKFKQKGKYSAKERTQIENEIAKHLKVNRAKIYEWKKEFGISSKKTNNERKHFVEKFDEMKAELTRGGFKNSYNHEIDETVAKELGLSFRTISNWKSELGQSTPKHKHSHSEQKELMKGYYEIKDKTPKISDEKIAKMLKIGTSTLYSWKKQFKPQQFHPNSVDGYSVEENATADSPEIENSNSGSI